MKADNSKQITVNKDQGASIKGQRGVALLWSLVTIAVLLAIAGSMAGLIIRESQMSSGIDASVRAYAAAESGIEHGSYLASTGSGDISDRQFWIEDNILGYKLTVDKDNPTEGSYLIISTGKSGNTTRKIEKTIDRGMLSQPSVLSYFSNPPTITSSSLHFYHDFSKFSPQKDPISGSYVQSFEIQTSSAYTIPPGKAFAIGLINNDNFSSNNIVLKFFNDRGIQRISLKINEGVISFGRNLRDRDSRPFSLEGGKNYKVYIEYKNGLAVKATIKELGVSDGKQTEECKVIITKQNPSGFRLGEGNILNNVYFYNDMGGGVAIGNGALEFKDSAGRVRVIASIPAMALK